MLRTNGGNRGCVIINIRIFRTIARKKYKIYLKFYQKRNYHVYRQINKVYLSEYFICLSNYMAIDYLFLRVEEVFTLILKNEYMEKWFLLVVLKRI